METISLKLENGFAREIERIMKKNNYTTKTEFIREAMRDKVENLEREYYAKEFLKLRGKAKVKTSDKQLRDIKWKVSEELMKEYNKKFNL
ncbi:MAG: ribbon-helix-helix domain-containing protein [archaeon]